MSRLCLVSMIPLLLASAALVLGSTPLTLERPWNLDAWKADGDYQAGNDVFRLGTKKGTASSVWTPTKVPWDEWTFEIAMRTFAGKEDPGHSGLAFFHTSEILGLGALHGADASYDGLAITVDSMGWDEHDKYNEGEDLGAVRGHLNDGTGSFSSHPAAEAFSLCRMPYRKTSEPITVKIGYGKGVFAVEVNNQRCFTSDMLVLPQGYFGVSASTGLSGDTFAIDSMRVTEGLDASLEKLFDPSQLEGGSSAPVPKKGTSVSYNKEDSVAPKQPSSGGTEQTLSVRDLDKLAEVVYGLESHLNHIQSSVDINQNKIDSLAVASGNSDASGLIEKLLERVGRLESSLDRITSSLDQQAGQSKAHAEGIQSLQQKVDKLPAHTSEASKVAASSSSPSLMGPCVVLLVGQGLLYVGYQAWAGRREKHQKLL